MWKLPRQTIMGNNLTLKWLGGGAESVPLDVSRDKSPTRVDLAAPFHDFFL